MGLWRAELWPNLSLWLDSKLKSSISTETSTVKEMNSNRLPLGGVTAFPLLYQKREKHQEGGWGDFSSSIILIFFLVSAEEPGKCTAKHMYYKTKVKQQQPPHGGWPQACLESFPWQGNLFQLVNFSSSEWVRCMVRNSHSERCTGTTEEGILGPILPKKEKRKLRWAQI